jgi:uncharacterized protein
MRSRNHRIACLAVAALAAAACTVKDEKTPTGLRFTTGPSGSTLYRFGETLSRAVSRQAAEVRIEIQRSAGTAANVEAIQQNRADLGIAFADLAYLASVGQLDQQRAPFDQLRAVTVISLTPVQLAAYRPEIRSVSDLRGRRIGLSRNYGTTLTAELILSAFNIRLSDVRQVPPSDFQRLSLQRPGATLSPDSRPGASETFDFRPGAMASLDWPSDAHIENAIGHSGIIEQAVRDGWHLVPITGPAVDALRRTYPFFNMTIVPPDLYPGHGPIPTVGVNSLLVCRRDLDEQVVYRLTASVFEALRSFSRSEFGDLIELEQAPDTSIPLHDGAARFFREQELLR